MKAESGFRMLQLCSKENLSQIQYLFLGFQSICVNLPNKVAFCDGEYVIANGQKIDQTIISQFRKRKNSFNSATNERHLVRPIFMAKVARPGNLEWTLFHRIETKFKCLRRVRVEFV